MTKRDYEKVDAFLEPNDFVIGVATGLVGGALFTFLGYLHAAIPKLHPNDLLSILEKFAADHGFDFDRTDCRFWDDIVKANFIVREASAADKTDTPQA